MKIRAMDFLVCPLDGTPLELVEWESRDLTLTQEARDRAEALGVAADKLSRDVITGVLLNRARRIAYPIHGGVPRLLKFSTGVAEEFQRQHGARLASELPGFSLPSEAAAPGEQDVLRTFSTEWTQYDWQGDTYWNKDADTWLRCMRFVLDPPGRSRGKLALEVGIGVGGVANDSSRSHESEVVGMDLGYGVDVAYKHFGENPWLHVVQASVFAPPFRDETFDFVYSFGVIHHTYDTNTAFRRVSRLPKRGGRLNIWVYSPQNERRSLLRRSQMVVERALRPLVWRLKEPFQTAALVPFVPAYVGHQAYKVLRGDPGEIMYGWREAVHAARDRLTPRYAHRHSEEEVSSWFDTAGYSDLQLLGKREAPQYVSVAFTAATGVDGIRKH